MRRLPIRGSHLVLAGIFVLAATSAISPRSAIAQEKPPELLKSPHPWAQFEVGAWKKMRLRRETLNENGQVVSASTTETTTTLVGIGDDRYELRIEYVVEVAGKRFDAQTKQVKRGFFEESNGEKAEITQLMDGNVVINGLKIPVQIQTVSVQTGDGQRISKFYRAANVSPFVLRQETSVQSGEKMTETATIKVDVVALNMPCKVLAETKEAAYVRTIVKQPKGAAITIEANCEDVPGGVVWHSEKELDENGGVIRRSTLELIDYDAGGSNMRYTGGRRGFLRRRRSRTSN